MGDCKLFGQCGVKFKGSVRSLIEQSLFRHVPAINGVMKSISFIPSLVLVSLFFSACAPRDVEVVSAEERAFIKSGKGRVSSSANGGGVSSSGIQEKTDLWINDNAMALLLLEKHAEILEVLSASGLERYTEKGPYAVEAKAESAFFDQSIVAAARKDLKMGLESPEFLTRITGAWQVEVAKEEVSSDAGVATKAVMINASHREFKITLDRAQKPEGNAPKLFANLQLSQGRLTAYPLKDSASYRLLYTGAGMLNAANDKMSQWAVQLRIEMDVELGSLHNQEIKISRLSSAILLGEQRPKEIKLYLPKEQTLIFKNDECARIIGQVQSEIPIFKKGQGRPEIQKRMMVLEESQTVVDDGRYRSENFVCSQRPTIDLSRLVKK